MKASPRFNLRLLCCLVWVLCLCSQSNGQIFGGLGKRLFSQKEAPIPTAFNRTPTQAEFLQLLQQRQTTFRQLSSDISVSLDGVPKLRGTMQLELPKRLRVKAGVMGVSQFGVDVGSNDDMFWVWTKVNLPNQKPAVFYASHDDFAKRSGQIRGSIPLEPVWLVESLGLIDFQDTDVHHGPMPTPEGFLKLFTVRNTASGKTTRVTTIHPTQGLVLQQALYDSQNNLIAYTDSRNYKWYAEHGISLPQNVDMYLYQGAQRARMAIDFGDFEFDTLFGDPNQMWTIRPPANIQTIDLSKLESGIR